MNDEDVYKDLTSLWGIGPWTVDMFINVSIRPTRYLANRWICGYGAVGKKFIN
jgi:hypothetical protein